ncbi:MAG: hypothetical protein OXN89_24370 [Bryobacterales bacterium]|nr:hypothetical protein [Bryobacterales bacterium]
MIARNSTPFLLNLDPSNVEEPVVCNREFLDSLDTIGVWLRVLAAYESLERYTSPESSSVQRLAALSNIYLQLGAQLEDQAVSLIAFSVWSKNRNLVLADLFSRIFVTRPGMASAGSEVQRVHAKLAGDCPATVRVDQRTFFGEVAKMDDAEIVEFFLGYWRVVPSVKLIPKRHIQVWRNLPDEFRRISSSFHSESQIPRITAAYNKLKHGPQLVIQNPMDRARQFGKSPDSAAELARFRALDKPSVRLLFAGARTCSGPKDSDARSVAPFLIDDEGAVRKLFFGTMVYHASLFSTLVKMQIALYRQRRIDIGGLDAGVSQIVEAGERYAKSRLVGSAVR